MRHGILSLSYGLRYFVSQIIEGLVYFPFAKTAYLLEKLGLDVSNIPLCGISAPHFLLNENRCLRSFWHEIRATICKRSNTRDDGDSRS
jgi:hypothetical protein